MLQTGETVKWVIENDGIRVFIPAALSKTKQIYPALAFSFTAK